VEQRGINNPTLKGLHKSRIDADWSNPFRVEICLSLIPRVAQSGNPGLRC